MEKQVRVSAAQNLFQNGRISFGMIAEGFLLGVFIFPSYFGIRAGFFDLTVLRFFEVLLLYMIVRNKKRKGQFVSLIMHNKFTIFIGIYFFVVVYTDIRWMALGGIFYTLCNWILVYYLILYLIKYEYGIANFLGKIKKYTLFLCVISPLQLIIGKSPFIFLDTLGKGVIATRFGEARISGNCIEANAYGLYLMLLLPLVCIDSKKKEINLGENKFLVLLLVINAILTGSRLAVGAAVLEFILLFLFSAKKSKINFGVFIVISGLIGIPLIVIFKDQPFVQSILRTVCSAVDAVLGTDYAVAFGAQSEVLVDSAYYRKLLYKYVFSADWLNPWFGRGDKYVFGLYVEGFTLSSVDNFYVGQYITYAYPGLIAWIIMSISFLIPMIGNIKRNSAVCKAGLVSFTGYFISLWYLDQLQTFTIMMAIFSLISCEEWRIKTERELLG